MGNYHEVLNTNQLFLNLNQLQSGHQIGQQTAHRRDSLQTSMNALRMK